MTDIVRGVLEDSRKGILLQGFDGGIVTDTGGLSLGPNQSPDSLNVFAWEGNLHFRGGFSQWSTLPAGADGAFTFYDVNQNAHMVEWAGGSMYEVTTGSPVLIRLNCYTAGQTIAHEQLNGVLYWSTLTVPLRQWDGTTEQAVVNAGGTGTVPPPACEFLVAFNGSLVAVNFVVAGVPDPGAFIWSDVNNPNKWVGANVQTVGSNDGAKCVFAILMGVAQVGVSPVKQFMVAKNNRQIFLYSGALSPGTLVEQAVSSPVGIIDGQTAVYIPTQQGLGAVMFLGDDGQFYLCNGIECTMSSNNIKLLCSNLINQALTLNPGQRFNAVYNQRFLYYMCDYGNNIQLAYKWDTGAWWFFQGWPSGVYSTAPTDTGLPSVFVGAQGIGTTGVYQLALDQTNDNGADIQAYYTTPYIHGGKPERLKLFQEVTMFSYNVGVQYKVTGYGLPQSNGVVPTTRSLLFNDPAVGATTAGAGLSTWGSAIWGQSAWSGGPAPSLTQPYQIGGMKGPLTVLSAVTKWAPAGFPVPLRSGGAQFKIEWNGGIPDFRVTSFKIALLFQNENVGILPFSNYGQVVTNYNALGNVAPGNKFMNRGQKLPLNKPGHSAGGAFGRLPGKLTVPGYAQVGTTSCGHLILVSNDGLHLYVLCEDAANTGTYLIKVNTATGKLEGSKHLGPAGSQWQIFWGPGHTTLTVIRRSASVFAFSVDPISLAINTSASFADGFSTITQASTDGSVIGCVTTDFPNNTVRLINVPAMTSAGFFTFPAFIGNNPGLTFPNGDNASVIVSSPQAGPPGIFAKYDFAGTPISQINDPTGLNSNVFPLSTNTVSGKIFASYGNPAFAESVDYGGATGGSVASGIVGNAIIFEAVVGTSMYGLSGGQNIVVKSDGIVLTSSAFPTEGGTLVDQGGLAYDATHGILYSECYLNDGVTYPLILQAIAAF